MFIDFEVWLVYNIFILGVWKLIDIKYWYNEPYFKGRILKLFHSLPPSHRSKDIHKLQKLFPMSHNIALWMSFWIILARFSWYTIRYIQTYTHVSWLYDKNQIMFQSWLQTQFKITSFEFSKSLKWMHLIFSQ